MTWWTDIPVGYYAIDEVYGNDECTEEWPVSLTTCRRTRTGFRMGAVYLLPGLDRVPLEDRYLCGRGWSLDDVRDIAVALVRDADEMRAAYGKFSGKCGCCNRPLTDPESKLRGIGPDCWRALAGAGAPRGV